MKDWNDYDKLTQDAVTRGSAVVECAYLASYELAFGKWHRSRDIKGGEMAFASYILNKKWTIEKEFNNHLNRFQQVRVSSSYFS